MAAETSVMKPGQMDVWVARDPVEYMTSLRDLQRRGNRIQMVQYVESRWVITYVVGGAEPGEMH